MASNTNVCGICDVNKPTIVWCSECDESFCLECEEHHGTSNHNTKPISQFENPTTNELEIWHFCSEHKNKFEIYCRNHDCPCCSKCIISYHQDCQDLIQLNDLIRNDTKSYDLLDIEQTIIELVENIQRIQKDRQENLSTLKEERKTIENEIQQTRIRVNAQLDNLQEALMKELYEADSKESMMICQLLDVIKKDEKKIKKYQENLINIKQHTIDLQKFLAIREMERSIAKYDEYITPLVTNNKLNRVSLSCKINDALQKSFNAIEKFGEVIVSSHPTELTITKQKEKQAQTAVGRSKSIDNLSFILQATIDTKLDNIRGCTLLPDGRMAFSCYKQHRVRAFNTDGSQDFDIKFPFLNCAFDITYIHESNSIAVTSGFGKLKCISIIDVESRKFKHHIPLQSHNSGIVSKNNTLIDCETENGPLMMNLTDKSVSRIRNMCDFDYIATFEEKLHCTGHTNTVTCCDQWKFSDESVLKYPKGISVDNDGNVYVAGKGSCNVVVISPD